MKIVIIIICAFILILLILGLYLSFTLTRPKRDSLEYYHKINHDNKMDEGIEKLKRTKFELTLRDGYLIHGEYSLNQDSNKYVILVHGWTANREAMIPQALVFYELGFNVILYDNRAHGENVHNATTMGKLESLDLNEVIDWTYKKFGKDIILGTIGVSLGGATVLLNLKYQKNLKFVISDCPYTNSRKLGIEILNSRHLPGLLLIEFIEFWTLIINHFSFKQTSAINRINDNKTPIMFIHGKKDTFINMHHSIDLYNKLECKKKIVLFACCKLRPKLPL